MGSSVYMEYTDLARLGSAAEQAKLRDWYKVIFLTTTHDADRLGSNAELVQFAIRQGLIT